MNLLFSTRCQMTSLIINFIGMKNIMVFPGFGQVFWGRGQGTCIFTPAGQAALETSCRRWGTNNLGYLHPHGGKLRGSFSYYKLKTTLYLLWRLILKLLIWTATDDILIYLFLEKFLKKYGLTFHVNHLPSRWFTWNSSIILFENIKKINLESRLLELFFA